MRRLVISLDSCTDVYVWILQNFQFQSTFFLGQRQTSANELNCMLVFSIISEMFYRFKNAQIQNIKCTFYISLL